ncbi:MAG: hypothetical protein ACW99G_20730 [Candidatus Thorarchaeota archaeon]
MIEDKKVKRGDTQEKRLAALRKPLRIVGPAVLNPDYSYLTLETNSGPVESKVIASAEFLKQELNEVQTMFAFSWKDIPKWLQDDLNCKKPVSRESVFIKMLKALREKPSEKNLRLSLAVLNELGRFPDGAEFITKNISQGLVDEFLLKEGEK